MSLLGTVLMFSLVGEAVSHARLTEPPARTTAWRFGFGTPVNYNDHETNCGGFSRQWTRNGGRCGPCGDPWDRARPREGEAGGRYGRGMVVRRYTEAATLAVRVDVTANHRGHFSFALCDRAKDEDDACFRRHPLVVADTGAARAGIHHRSRQIDSGAERQSGTTDSLARRESSGTSRYIQLLLSTRLAHGLKCQVLKR